MYDERRGAGLTSSITGTLSRIYAYDPAGNALTYGQVIATYNNRGRMSSVAFIGSPPGSANLTYNALGELIDINGLLTWRDEAGHVLGEYVSSGTLQEETVWLGDIPVATLRPSGSSVAIYYVHSDHLNTPRQVTRPSDGIQMWRWPSDPFWAGDNTNPQGAGTFNYHLRLPGQVLEGPAQLRPNGFRDYDPYVGRYVESDPIGLHGGINPYAYVRGNPLSFADPLGTQAALAEPVVVGGAIVVLCYATGACQQISQGLQNMYSRGQSDPVSGETPYNPGRDCDGNCKPCKPNQFWEAPGDAHGSTGGSHWHGIIWNQDPSTCMCYPKRVSGPSLDQLK